MRICVFMHRFDDGGAEKVTICLLNELQKLGHEITLLMRYDEGPARELLSPQIRVLNMDLPVSGKLKKNIRNVQYLCRVMKSGDYDLMLAILSDMSQVAAVSKWICRGNLPLISVVHSTLSIEKISFPKVRHFLAKFFDRQYDRVFAVSEAVRQDYLSYCGCREEKAVTIYNPIVNDALLEKAKERPDHPWLREGREFTTLLLVGRLSYPKNHPLMFQTLKLLRERGDYRLILLGEGELRQELTELVREMELEPWVDFHGFDKNPYGYMGHCDCVVLSSHYEGLPTVVVEALACGSRMVSVDCPSGPREILEGGKYGVLVEPGDPEQLRDGILQAMQTQPDREVLVGRAMDFTVENAVKKYEDELCRTLNRSKES